MTAVTEYAYDPAVYTAKNGENTTLQEAEVQFIF